MSHATAASPTLAQSTLATVVSAIAGTLRGAYAIDPEPVLLSVGIDPAVMLDSELRLTMTTLSPLWLRCVELTGDEAFGLRVARYFQPAQFYGIDLALCTSATFGEALQRHVQIIRVLTTIALPQLSIDANGDCRLEIRRHGPQRPTDAALDCFFQAFCIRLFERQTGLHARQLLRRLELPRPPPKDPTPWRALGLPVTFGCACGAMVFKFESLAMPLPGANPHLLAQLEQPILRYLAQLGLPLPPSALRSRLADMLTETPDVQQLATELDICPKLLRRNLTSQGLTFSQLLDQAREAQALVLLANPALSLEQVASKLGFSSTSSLVRAFRRWQNNTPMAYRRQALG
ncbi:MULTISPECIES: AraC family transcriptional regulator [Pseudomonas]|uniref:AraC family transcriptional regulator n=1 Tax=Pseudomonas TaxID=286 RepID=UPI000A69D3C5|nr:MULTISPECIES: AraC family transcriptional regulator [Pseudomonas]